MAKLSACQWLGEGRQETLSTIYGNVGIPGVRPSIVVLRSTIMKPALTRKQLEYCRQEAIRLFGEGLSNAAIARRLGVSRQSVSTWHQRFHAQGSTGLQMQPPGPRARVTDAQFEQMAEEWLRKGPEAFGFLGQAWTLKRVAAAIESTMQVKYHPSHVWRLLKKLDWSCQKPELRATQRDEEAIQKWREENWPALKRAQEEGFTILFIDEAGFYLLPAIVRTWAPRGQTPILKHKSTRDHLSAIAAITPRGDLFMQVQDSAFNGQAVVDFLRQLLQQIAGPIIVVWDCIPIHRGNVMKRFLADTDGIKDRLILTALPSYAPELNPVDGVWRYLKRVELKNICCQNLRDLQQELKAAEERLRRNPEIIRSCLKEVGYC